MTKHTPGRPWTCRAGSSPHYQGQIWSDADGSSVAITYNDENSANARLIAAAPEPLEALQNIKSNLTGRDYLADRISDSLRRAEEAIAKAEGK